MTASAARPTELSRPLSPLERWFWILEELSPLNVVARFRVRGVLPEARLRQALDALQARHPLLRVAIAAEAAGRRPRYVPVSRPIPLRVVATAAGDADGGWVREINEHELAERIDRRHGPLCRVAVLTVDPAKRVHDLLFSVSHIISDAVTALSLARQLLELAAADGRSAGAGERALPAPEEMFPARFRGLAAGLRIAWQALPDLIRQRWRRPVRLTPSASIPDRRRRTRFTHRSLTPDQLGALATACRRENVTVHGALAAAMVTALARDQGVATRRVAVIGSPIDFRSQLVPPVSGHEVGAYVATVPSFVDHRPGAPLWAMARAISRDLAKRKERGDHFSTINLLRWVCPPNPAAAEKFLTLVEASGPGNLCLSNIGRYDFPDVIGPWQISHAQYVSGLSASGYVAALVNTSHGRLFWNFAHIDEAVPSARAERLATESVNILLSAIGQLPVGAAATARG